MVRSAVFPPGSGSRIMRGAAIVFAVTIGLLAGQVTPSFAQILTFPLREKPTPRAVRVGAQDQMLVRAQEINYDYTNERVSAVGNVQLYYGAATLEADRVIYDQKTKRLHAEGKVRLTQPDGTVTYGEIMDLSDDFRDGFVDAVRADAPEQTRFAAIRAERSGENFTVFHNGVYTACEACKDDPTKPPKWQVKAMRIVHDQSEKMMYFEDARLELAGVPVAYIPFFSAPDPTVKRKSGFLTPMISTSSVYGAGVTTPYYFALAPDYDATFTPMITTKQGPLLQGEWRQRLLDGSYSIRATGIYQLDKDAFVNTPGYHDWRGSLETKGQFNLSEQWTWGWESTVLSDINFLQDYGLQKNLQVSNPLEPIPDYALSQFYITGRGDRSYFETRALYFYGLSPADSQSQIPTVHPVIDQDYVFKNPILNGEVEIRSNFTSLSRSNANFDPISGAAVLGNLCAPTTADTAVLNSTNCLLRGVPGQYNRFSSEASWKRTIIDPWGQVFTPFLMVRADVADIRVDDQPGVSNYINVGQSDVGRVMPTAGLEYRYPLINVQSWGTQTVEPVAQFILRPNETGVGTFPNEDAQSLIFDDSNLFKVDKFSGWDRVEGGGRANVGVQYTAQFNHGGNINLLFGQSYQLFGQNSFALPSATNTGLDSGLDTTRSDYVARATYQPNSMFTFSTRFRFAESDFTLQRTELETTANFGRWTTTVIYGDYAAQPDIGFLTRRQGILSTAKFKLTPNWILNGALQYDLEDHKVVQTQAGIGYIDDCVIVGLNYITNYAYSGSVTVNNTIMLQISLRTLGGTTAGTSPSALNGAGLH